MNVRHFHRHLQRLLVLALLLLAVPAATALDGRVEKQSFTLPHFTTESGITLKQVRFGYETYGKLNARRDNVVFIAHYFSGSSHAAGRYAEQDAAPGYWDAIIGAGKPIDTDKYFVVSADTLANLNTGDPRVITTGPASREPETGKPYGLGFPVVTPRDFVRVHKALLDTLGVTRLHAVAGPSGGSIQAMEWAVLYPDYVPRVVHAIGPGFRMPAYGVAMLDSWSAPIRLDANWHGGDYYGHPPPLAGLASALKLVRLNSQHFDGVEAQYGKRDTTAKQDPSARMTDQPAIVSALDALSRQRAVTIDANHFLYTSRAYQLFDVEQDLARIKAKILFIPSRSDLLFPPFLSQRAAEKFRAAGKQAEVFVLESESGHLAGLSDIAKAGEAIRRFLAQ